MSNSLSIDKAGSALLIIDYQNAIVPQVAVKDPELLTRASAVLQTAREVGLPVIYVVTRFRPGYPEISAKPTTRILELTRTTNMFVEGMPGVEIHAQVAPLPQEIIVTKRRAGAFSTTDLAVILKARNITSLLLMGITTSGAVLSTVRWAADLDYELFVVEDGCADFDEEVHRMVTQKIFPVQSTVVKAQDLITALKVTTEAN